MPKIKYEEWCVLNNLDPDKKTSKTAFNHFIKAFTTQAFIARVLKRKQNEEEVQCL